MIGEVAAKAIEVTAEFAKETAKEVGKKAKDISVDITKRIDTSAKSANLRPDKIDITKRIPVVGNVGKELSGKEITNAVKDYMKDLKKVSEYAKTIPKDIFKDEKIERVSFEEVKELRKEFNKPQVKESLIAEWEKLNNCKWPTYKEDLTRNDVVIREKGMRYDAHHIRPLSIGGKNIASNITPLDRNSHIDIHMSSGSCGKLAKIIEGVGRT